ncbi:MAG: DegT/DnrJ/EryC1/StrS family aminotransferase [Pseudomonadales bacterium]|nr:DegT/DnrJ/EryC1/StrS family aminotransferase [Pseudomonadales bacterium]
MAKRYINLGNANLINDLLVVLVSLVRRKSLLEGVEIKRFERNFVKYMGGEGEAFSFNAGRVALAAILRAMDVGNGDEVIIPAYTCVAVPNPVLVCGAKPVYADIDKETGNIDLLTLPDHITERTKAIVIQHTFGIPVDMEAIRSFVERKDIRLIEDCTHALGSKYQGKPVGLFGDASFFSFEQSKVISTGSGGVAFSRDESVIRKLNEYQQECVFPDEVKVKGMLWYLIDLILFSGPYCNELTKPLSYYLNRFGFSQGPVTTADEMACRASKEIFKYKLPNALARIGCAQLKRLNENIAARKRIADIYQQAIEKFALQTFKVNKAMEASFVRYPLVVSDKEAFAKFMRQFDIQTGLWFSAPIHPHGVDHEAAGYKWGSCPNAEWAVKRIANLPINPRMTDADAKRVVDCLGLYLSENS